MEINLPARSSVSNPASPEALAVLRRILGDDADHLIPLYRITDGFENVIRGGEFHLQLWPIEEWTLKEEHLVVIGSDSEAADLVVNTKCEPAIVETWCAFGGGRFDTLSSLPDFLAWILAEPTVKTASQARSDGEVERRRSQGRLHSNENSLS